MKRSAAVLSLFVFLLLACTRPGPEGAEATYRDVGNGGVGTAPPADLGPSRAGTGEFEVVGPTVYDPDGARFVPLGTNMNGPYSFFEVTSLGKAAELREQWGFNTVRLVSCLPGGCRDLPQSRGDDLDAVIAEYSAQRMVAIVEYHQLSPGWLASPADIAEAIRFWEGVARRHGANPYVWFNLFNEPDSVYHDWQLMDGTTAAERWARQHQQVIDAVRATGARNVIVANDTQTGQGAADWWSIGPSPAEDSGIMSQGRSLVDPLDRLVFSVHAYDVWGFPNDNDPTCATRYTDAQRDARFRFYVQRILDQGLPLMVGEVGFRVDDRRDRGVSVHGEGGANHPPCGSTTLLAAETLYRVAPEFDLGILTWHGFPLTEAGGQHWELEGRPPTNLTYFGQLHYDYVGRFASR
jgi:hypothetical protein